MLGRNEKQTELQVISIFTNLNGMFGVQARTEENKVVYIPHDDKTVQFPEYIKKAVFLRFWKNESGDFLAEYRTACGRIITVNKNLHVIGVK